jgi:hypothetical protein
MFIPHTLNHLRAAIRGDEILTADLVARTAVLLNWGDTDLLLALATGAAREAADVYARIARDLHGLPIALDAYAVAAHCAFNADEYALTRTLIDDAEAHAAKLEEEVPPMIRILQFDSRVKAHRQTTDAT